MAGMISRCTYPSFVRSTLFVFFGSVSPFTHVPLPHPHFSRPCVRAWNHLVCIPRMAAANVTECLPRWRREAKTHQEHASLHARCDWAVGTLMNFSLEEKRMWGRGNGYIIAVSPRQSGKIFKTCINLMVLLMGKCIIWWLNCFYEYALLAGSITLNSQPVKDL